LNWRPTAAGSVEPFAENLLNVSQYIAQYLALKGAGHVFTLTGGGAMFLNDAFGFADGLSAVYCHHEQACAMAAEGYARVKGSPGVVNVTTGPGGINALNGVFGAFTDSIPMLVLSGQVKRATHLRSNPKPGLRQLGDQEVDIVAMATPVCKWAHSLLDPLEAPSALAKAWALCQSGRPGPVWLDIPIDVQSSPLPDALAEQGLAGAFDDQGLENDPQWLRDQALSLAAESVAQQIAAAKRPLMLWGTGVSLADAAPDLLAAAEMLDCPIATGWTHDTLESAHRLHAGRPGTIGTRAGNFALQACDLLVVLGSRLNVRQTSYNFSSFAKNAKIIQVDVDPAELSKGSVKINEGICAHLKSFAPMLAKAAATSKSLGAQPKAAWLAWIGARKAAYPDTPPAAREGTGTRELYVNPYAFVEALALSLPERSIMAVGNASACIVPFQAAKLRPGMRLFSNSGSASMGYDIPAAIGAAVADPSRTVACLAGDGSAQLNIQELETIVRLNLPIKVVILDNEGYLSIKSSQSNFFGRLAGCDAASGVGFPDYVQVARAYGLRAVKIDATNWRENLAAALATPGPLLIHAKLDPLQGFEPRMSSRQLPDGQIVSPELEDMHPFLPPEELLAAMDISSTEAQ
jgi:acetolactate synthase-1/2/3 large subunit